MASRVKFSTVEMADWNERYKHGEHTTDEPHPLLVKFASGLAPGCALDVACGTGRNAIWLAQRGWQVTAVDNSTVAIDILRERSANKSVEVDCRVADLECHEFVIRPRVYDLVVVCNYLQRDLFPSIREGTRTGGIVIAAIAMVDDNPGIRPMNPAYLLNPGELRREFAGWEWIWDFESKSGTEPRRATAEVVARRSR